MEKTFVLFSDLIGQDAVQKSFDQLQLYFRDAAIISIDSEKSPFHAVKELLPEIKSKWTILVLGDIFNWSEAKWNSYLKLVESNGNCVEFLSNSQIELPSGVITGVVSCFETFDLQMALDQNYRPNFENIHEAFETFGFKPYFVNVLTG